MTFRFMGIQEDPEADTFAARGGKVYDATGADKYGLRTDDGERLPPGKSCADCAYFAKCDWLVATPPDSERCDWAPSRFEAVSSTPTRRAERGSR